MSVHQVYYKNRVKMMRPVLDRAEYLAIRDSEKNRLAEKMKMEQFNYGLSPQPSPVEGKGVDFPLRGCKTPGNTVGMDIDLSVEENEKEKQTYEIRDRILARKEELGILMLEQSATKGYHIVFRRKPNLSQEENLQWMSKQLGVEYDKGAKDITRVFFTPPTTHLLYLDDEIFSNSNYENLENNSNKESSTTTPKENKNLRNLKNTTPNSEANEECSTSEQESGTDRTPVTVENTAPTSPEIPKSIDPQILSYHGIPYAEIIRKYWDMFNEGMLPSEGDRNAKTYELALTLRSILDYSLEKMKLVIPRYDNLPEEEFNQTLENALKAPQKGMSYRLKQVLSALKQDKVAQATGGTLTTPPPLPEKLPPLIKLLTKNVPGYYKAAVASAVFPALGTHLHGVSFRYWDNVDHEATFMNVLIGRQSVGKGCIKKPIDYILKDIIERDQMSREREAEWKRKNPSGKTKAKDPRPTDICIQVLIDNLTDAVFNQRIVDAHNNGQRYIFTIVDEIEALKKVTSRGTVDEVSLLIRKAFDNSMAGQERVGPDSVSGIAPLRWNWNASTTPPNARRFFQKAVNDGTIGRLDISSIIINDEDMEDPIIGIYDDVFADALRPYLQRLESAYGLVECPQATALAKEMKKENEENAKLYDSEAYRVLSYRANVIAWLKGMVLYVAQGYRWTKEIEDFVRWSQAYNLWCKLLYFGQQLEEELASEKKMQQTTGPQNLLSLLPSSFSSDDYRKMREHQGKDPKSDDALRKWKQRGHIEWDEVQQCWQKTEKYLKREQRP